MSNNTWKGGTGDFGLGANWSTGHKGGNDEIDTGDATIAGTETITNVPTLLIGPAGNLTVKGTLDDSAITNEGTIYDYGSIVAKSATLTNSGLLEIGRLPEISATNPVTAKSGVVNVAAINNTGEIELNGLSQGTLPSAVVRVHGAAGFGTAGVITGDVSLRGSSEIKFDSGSFTSIAAGGTLKLDGPDAMIAIVGGANAFATLATNDGSLDLYGGASITTTTALTNFGTIDLEKGVNGDASSLTIGGALNNQSGAEIILGDTEKLAGFDTLTISGALNNSGDLYLGSSTLANGVTVTAASLVNTATGDISLETASPTSSTATLDIAAAAGFGTAGVVTGDVYLQGNSTLEFASGQLTTIASGGGLEVNGANAFVSDATALGSNSALNVALVNGYLELDNGASETTTGSLTVNGSVYLDYNEGSVKGGTALKVGGALINNGYVRIGANDLLANDALTAASLVNYDELSLTGTVGAGEASLTVASAAGTGASALDVGELTGDVYLTGNATLAFASGQITTIANNAYLELNGAETFVADTSALGSNSALNLTQVQGSLELDNGESVTSSGALTVSGHVYIDDYSNAKGGSSLTVTGSLTNEGDVYVGYKNITANDTLTVGSLINDDFLDVVGSPGGGEAIVDDKAAAGTGTVGTITGGVSLVGNATLEFASGQITNIEGYLGLDGAAAFVADSTALGSNSALNLSVVSGSLELDDGASVTSTGNLTVSGTVNIDDYSGAKGGSSLTVGGAIINSGSVNIGSSDIVTNDTVTVAALANYGNLTLDGNPGNGEALLKVDTVADFGTLGEVTGDVSLAGNSTIEFTSGQIKTVEGILFVLGTDAFVADSSALGSNSALNISQVFGQFGIGNGASEKTTGSLLVDGTLYVDANSTKGGSTLTIAGELLNEGLVSIGGENILANDTVTAASLVNEADLDLTGNPGEGEAILNVASAADFEAQGGPAGTLTGQVSIIGNATLEFASGQISTIVGGASLDLDGAAAFISDAASLGANSALNLTEVAGELQLNDGASLTSTGILTITATGDLYVDRNTSKGGTSLTVDGQLINDDDVVIGSANLAANDKVTVASLVNDDNLTLKGDPGHGQAILDVLSAAGFAAAGVLTGDVSLSGNAVLEFASGSIATIAGGATLSLFGADTFVADASTLNANSALTGLAQVNGNLELNDGASVSIGGPLTVAGRLYVDDDSIIGGSSLTISGALTNDGFISIGGDDLIDNDKVTVGSLVNNNEILEITGNSGQGQSVLDDLSAAGFGGAAGTVTGIVELFGNATLEFSSGEVTTVAAGATLELSGDDAFVADSTALGSNSALTGLTTVTGDFELLNGATVTTSGPLTVTGFVDLDFFFSSGGSSLTVGGALTNNGEVSVGAGGIIADDKLTVASFTNNNELFLDGNYDFGEAIVTINSAASFSATAGTVTGEVSLQGASEIVFASASLTTIAAGASLSLDGPDAFINDAGGVADSALSGLTTNDGTLDLSDGASVSLTGPVTNAAGADIYLDYSFGVGGTKLTVAGTLTNAAAGDIYIGNTSQTAVDTLSATTIVNSQYIETDGNSTYGVIINGAITNTGTVDDNIGTLTLNGAVSGAAGTLELGNDSFATSLTLNGSVAASQTVSFDDFFAINETLVLGDATGFSATISGFDGLFEAAGAQKIDVKGFVQSSAATFAGDVLTLHNGASSVALTFNFAVTGADFNITTTATDTIIKNAV